MMTLKLTRTSSRTACLGWSNPDQASRTTRGLQGKHVRDDGHVNAARYNDLVCNDCLPLSIRSGAEGYYGSFVIKGRGLQIRKSLLSRQAEMSRHEWSPQIRRSSGTGVISTSNDTHRVEFIGMYLYVHAPNSSRLQDTPTK